jgi:hypothetical protein
LLRLRDGRVEAFPIADAIVEKIKSMPEAESNKLLSALAKKADG